jgi:hypothetical protein
MLTMSSLAPATRRSLRRDTDYSTDTRVLLAMRLYNTPLYRFRDYSRTNKALALAKLRRECQVNDWAAVLRTQGYTVPVGSILCGELVTR